MADQWEYRVEAWKVPDLGTEGMQSRMNRLGEEGWELVTSMSTVKTWVNLTGNDVVMIFKRPGVGPWAEERIVY